MQSTLALTRADTQPTTNLQQRDPWDRLEDQGETPAAYSRFLRFLHLGPRRSLLALYRAELAEKAALAGERPKKPDSTPSSLRELTKRFDWWNRAAQFTTAENAADQADYEASRRERMSQLLEQEWNHGQQMVTTASVALSHGDKFFSRRVVEKPSRFEIDPVSGEKIRIIERVVFLELKVGDINRMMIDGGKKMRQSVGMTSEKAQEEFSVEQSKPPMDTAVVDQEIYEMFEALGANKPVPQPTVNPDA